jgi:hypothetical protein
MQFEDREPQSERPNVRPKEASRNLPMAVLLVLVGIICALLYIGWKYMSDDTSSAEELTTQPADSIANAIHQQPTSSETDTDTTTLSDNLPAISVPKVGDKTTNTNTATATKPVEAEKPKPETPKASIPSGGEAYTHLVGEGETFFGIANRFNMKKETLQAMNPNIEPNGIKIGVTKLKVRIKAVHTVGPGDILLVVAKKYGITVEQLMAANRKTKNYAARGEKLIIPFAEKE